MIAAETGGQYSTDLKAIKWMCVCVCVWTGVICQYGEEGYAVANTVAFGFLRSCKTTSFLNKDPVHLTSSYKGIEHFSGIIC